MDEAVLVDADVDEGTERGDVGDAAFEDHPGLEVLHVLDAVGELGHVERGARIAAGLLEFLEDIAHGRQAEFLVGILFRLECAQEGDVADDLLHFATAVAEDALDHRIGFRMHARRIERIVAVGHAQEARALLEGLVAETRHLEDRSARAERAMLVAILDHVFGDARAESGDARQQRARCGIDVDADAIDAVLDHGIERTCQLHLVDVVLVLADANGLRFDLDQFREWILQASRD